MTQIQKMTATDRVNLSNRKKELAEKTIDKQMVTIRRYGIDPNAYRSTVIESILLNPQLIYTDDKSFSAAIRLCCHDGLIPNGREAVIYPNKDQTVTYMQMKEGLMKMIYQATKASIKSGHIREGDDYTIEEVIGQDPTIRIKKCLDDTGEKKVIAAWCWMKIGDELADFLLLTRSDIENAKKASRAHNSPAWRDWYGRMAEKTAIKSLMISNRYKIFNDRTEHIFKAIDNDVSSPVFKNDDVVVEATEIEEEPKVTRPRVRRKKKPDPVQLNPPVTPEVTIETVKEKKKEPEPEPVQVQIEPDVPDYGQSSGEMSFDGNDL